MEPPGRQISPPPDIKLNESLDPAEDTGGESQDEAEQEHTLEESSEGGDADVSMAHATEVDMLLSSDVSQRSEPSDHEDQEEESVPEQDDSTVELPTNPVDDALQERTAEEPVDITQPFTDSSSGRVPPPDSRTATDHPTTREVISALLPGILDTSSQTQTQTQSQAHSLPTETQERALIPQALPAQIISNVLVQPDPIPTLESSQSQQETTHSPIKEPASSWNIPQPSQLPPQNDTISNFTPTNPSVKPSPAIPSPDRERVLPPSPADAINGHDGVDLPSNQDPPSQVNGSEPSQETRQDHSNTPFFPTSSRSSELGAVPEMNMGVFKKHARHVSPESDIGDFSPQKSSPARSSSQSSERASLRPYQQKVANQASPSPRDTWNSARRGGRASLHNSPSPRLSASEDSRKQIQEQATRIQTLLADLANLEAAKKAIEAEATAFVDSTNRLNEILQQEREEHAEEIETHSTEAKRMSDENKILEARVEKQERQLSSGLRQWQAGFESNVARYQQEIQTLKGQLKIEREMYSRSKAPDLCRRAAECTEAERREALLREREVEIRRRELEIADREQALKDSVRAMQSQAQTTQRLSQDDLQTETMLTDRSAVLTSLDGDLGEELVWMCSYRENTGKICGKVFDSMGMLLTHVLDAAGHKVEAACDCAQAS
ncbi:hypothetical protein B0J17DRAFT_670627 [Rhizoctonia solani]|nr:hypothetical protein B0J17DRAFT_670627 [Rhizoctonia solani]